MPIDQGAGRPGDAQLFPAVLAPRLALHLIEFDPAASERATDTRVAVAWANDDGADYSVKAQALATADLSPITAQLTVDTTVPTVEHVVVHIGPVGDTYVAWDGQNPATEDGVFARGIDAGVIVVPDPGAEMP